MKIENPQRPAMHNDEMDQTNTDPTDRPAFTENTMDKAEKAVKNSSSHVSPHSGIEKGSHGTGERMELHEDGEYTD